MTAYGRWWFAWPIVTNGRLLDSAFFRIQSRSLWLFEEPVIRGPFQAVPCLTPPKGLTILLSFPPPKVYSRGVRGLLFPFGVSYGNIGYPR